MPDIFIQMDNEQDFCLFCLHCNPAMIGVLVLATYKMFFGLFDIFGIFNWCIMYVIVERTKIIVIGFLWMFNPPMVYVLVGAGWNIILAFGQFLVDWWYVKIENVENICLDLLEFWVGWWDMGNFVFRRAMVYVCLRSFVRWVSYFESLCMECFVWTCG